MLIDECDCCEIVIVVAPVTGKALGALLVCGLRVGMAWCYITQTYNRDATGSLGCGLLAHKTSEEVTLCR